MRSRLLWQQMTGCRDDGTYLHGVQRVHYAMLHHPRDRAGGHVRDGALGRKSFIVLKVHNNHLLLSLYSKYTLPPFR